MGGDMTTDHSPTAFDLIACKIASGPYKPHHRRCSWCGAKLSKNKKKWCSIKCSTAYRENHHWNAARKAAKKRDGYKCTKCGSTKRLEVNHIEPCLGKHSECGCWHHQDNLETLCNPCHTDITKIQRAEGKIP